ncbi:MAG: hypothetical protein PHT40_01860 [Patescibacteria group bacterium]|nr:hypothetical protein [Patescibacteria group bacterium]
MSFEEKLKLMREKNKEKIKSILDPKFIELAKVKFAEELEKLNTEIEPGLIKEELSVMPEMIIKGEKIKANRIIVDKLVRIVSDSRVFYSIEDLRKLYDVFLIDWEQIVNFSGL